MQATECQTNVEHLPPKPAPPPWIEATRAEDGGAALLHPLELEKLMLNMDVSLRVHTRHQLFGWAQGTLQNLIKHELLICALRGGEPRSYQVDSFAAPGIEPSQIGDLFRRDAALVPHLVKKWEEGQFLPVRCEVVSGGAFAGGTLGSELKRMGVPSLLAHGTYDVLGRLATLFVFATAPGRIGAEQGLFVELIVPFLHLAWMRTQVNRPIGGFTDAAQKSAALLSAREQEILRWIHLGKSNIEIGAILGISPLTVKNHVQKILRKMNVQNRTQAVGKALALRILNI